MANEPKLSMSGKLLVGHFQAKRNITAGEVGFKSVQPHVTIIWEGDMFDNPIVAEGQEPGKGKFNFYLLHTWVVLSVEDFEPIEFDPSRKLVWNGTLKRYKE